MPRLAVRCRGLVGKLGLSREIACEFKLFRGGKLAVLPQAPSRLRPDRWPERAKPRVIKCSNGWPCKVCGPVAGKRVKGRTHLAGTPTNAATAPLFSRMMLGKSKSDKIVTSWMPVFNDVWKNWRKTGKDDATAQLTGDDRG